MSDEAAEKVKAPAREDWEEVVRQQVRRLRFGVVQITVHEGRVTQVDATEKTRLAGRSELSG
jgi:hypothetical protein